MPWYSYDDKGNRIVHMSSEEKREAESANWFLVATVIVMVGIAAPFCLVLFVIFDGKPITYVPLVLVVLLARFYLRKLEGFIDRLSKILPLVVYGGITLAIGIAIIFSLVESSFK